MNTYYKKRRIVVNTDDEIEEVFKSNITQEKKTLVKRVGKNSTKASVPISGLIGRISPEIKAIFMITNIVIPALHLFQILPKFSEETRRFITIPQRPHKKVIPPTNLSKDDKNRLYIRAKKSNQNLVQTNHGLVLTLKQKLAEIIRSKKEAFRMIPTV